MKTNTLGYPRIGDHRELKRACEKFWKGEISESQLRDDAKSVKSKNWFTQKEAGIDLIPSNDFSFYDQVLDMSLLVGAIPDRFKTLQENKADSLALYFAMARGYQQNGLDITAMEMTKWFDTNYHYIVPEFSANQQFSLQSDKIVAEFEEAKVLGIITKPVIIGPVSYLLLGKEKEAGFHRITLLEKLLPVYDALLQKLSDIGVQHIQIDEPYLAMDLSKEEQNAFQKAYTSLSRHNEKLALHLTSYFGAYQQNLTLALNLPVKSIHLDLTKAGNELNQIITNADFKHSEKQLSLGVVNGRNIWKCNYAYALPYIKEATKVLGNERVLLSSSCSLLHVPCDLELENNTTALNPEIKSWMAFAKQKLNELYDLKQLSTDANYQDSAVYLANQKVFSNRNNSLQLHNYAVKDEVKALTKHHTQRNTSFSQRSVLQREHLKLPDFPTTTIGSFPQTASIRKNRARFRKGEINKSQYEDYIAQKTRDAIHWQEDIGLDVLVHGEFERNDMVEYFGELLEGFAFTRFGWVQSYGSRCVKPPIIFGDVAHTQEMTVQWSTYAQSLTEKPVKGMLTGPVTILQWSFVRDDQPRAETCKQIALAIRKEVAALEKAGIHIIQVDEPALREGLPLRKSDWKNYLQWAVDAFKIASSGVQDSTQIHTHMCYSEFNDIIESIAAMDADVITIECSRSQMELLDAFADFQYPNDIGPGVYDIHSPRVPSKEEMTELLEKAKQVIASDKLWVNPDCGLKTRAWEETNVALRNMVATAKGLREEKTLIND